MEEENTVSEGDLSARVKELEARLAVLDERDGRVNILLFSGEFDRVLAALYMASGALAMGKEVSLFVTFWGFDIIKRPSMSMKGKGFLERMMLHMRPKGLQGLPTSQMNFMGIGPKLFAYMMRSKSIQSVEPIFETCRDMGLKIVACSTTMALMGLKEEDLIDGVQVGGVGTFLGNSFNSQVTVFM
ncbi:MAG: DsrE/DsrF/DrsH-like family protein [Candidatus Methylomirabilia bacterium]